MGKTAKKKLVTMKSFRIFGGSLLSDPLPDILTKNIIKENASIHNIWVPFYILNG